MPTPTGFPSALLLVVTLLAAAPARAQAPYHDDATFPSGPLGERTREILEAVESGNPDRVRILVRESFAPAFRDMVPLEEHVNVLLGVFDQSGGLEFHSVRSYEGGDGPPGTVVIVRNRLTGGWEALVIRLEPEAPHRVASLQLSPARPPSDLPPPPPLSREEAIAELDRFLRRLADAQAFSGAVLLARDDEVLLQGAYGPALRGFEVANRVDTKFNLGSMNKMFTAVAIAQLVEAGKLSYEDPISGFLDADWLPGVDMTRIRVKHLLTHTSGLGSYFNARYIESSRELFREVDDYKRLTAGDSLAFEPGTSWRYSNTGFLLLGAVLEKASGGNYFDYVRTHLYRPAGMVNSDCYDMDLAVPNLAVGWSRERRGDEVLWRNNLYSHVIRGGPAGGGFSTVEDLFRFGRALRSGKLVSKKTAETLWSPKPDLGSPEYGYGFRIDSGPRGRIVGHSGGFPGISSNLDLFLDAGYTAVVLSNLDGGSDPVEQKMRELVSRIRD